MENKDNNKRTRKVTVRFTQAEYRKIQLAFQRTTKRKLGQYIRSVVLEKPVTVYTRNQSYDDFVAEMIMLRNELSAIGNNFNQAVKRLHTASLETEIKWLANQLENHRQHFFKKTDEINSRIAKIADQWSQE